MTEKPKIGLALSGSGNRTAFYVGFLEVFEEKKVPLDYLVACSGASIIAAAYACDSLKEFKEWLFKLSKEELYKLIRHKGGRGGLYSLERVEEELRNFTKNKNFEEVRPLMGFLASDLESGQQVVLSMGDIARAACISSAVPGIFEPVKWGDKTLVDGGLLNYIPVDILKEAQMDISIAVDMGGMRHIFFTKTGGFKKVLSALGKILFVKYISKAWHDYFAEQEVNPKNPGLFSVLGRSLDLAISAHQKNKNNEFECSLMITPNIPKVSKILADEDFYRMEFLYHEGRRIALENVPKIKKLILEWQKNKVKQVQYARS